MTIACTEFIAELTPIMEAFTQKNGKPLSFFFDAIEYQGEEDNLPAESIGHGYVIFEDGELLEEVYYPRIDQEDYTVRHEDDEDGEYFDEDREATTMAMEEAVATEEIEAAFSKWLTISEEVLIQSYPAVVQEDGFALRFVPETQRTPELCLAAVQQNGYTLTFVPEALRTPELCLIAVQSKGLVLEFVPEALKTPELCRTAVKQNKSALEFVPEALKAQAQAALAE